MPTGPSSLLHAGRNLLSAAAPASPPIVFSASRRLIVMRHLLNVVGPAVSTKMITRDDHKRLATQPTPTQNPTAVPIPDATAMSRIRVTGLRQNPLNVCTSSGNRSQSATLGRRRHASTTPTTM